MKNKLIAYALLVAGIIYYMSKQGIIEILKTNLMIILVLFGLLTGYLINKYIK